MEEQHGVLGHNSRGIDIDAEEQEPPRVNMRTDIDALVTRATQVQSQHIAARRKRLTMVTLRPQDLPGGGEAVSGNERKR
jgi:hypothetical protein